MANGNGIALGGFDVGDISGFLTGLGNFISTMSTLGNLPPSGGGSYIPEIYPGYNPRAITAGVGRYPRCINGIC